MKVLGKHILDAFRRGHADVRSQLSAWCFEAEAAEWRVPSDITDRYVHASIIDGNRVVFNIKGNKYRMLVRVSYKNQIVRILKIGTHAEYDTWDL